jgi:hypothetical protein
MLVILLGYTIWQLRSRRLDAHVTVRWILAESAAIVAVLLWRWLPLFKITSSLGDRELLMVLTVIFFALIAFLMIDSVTRISTHTRQIKQLTQELALLRASTEPTEPTEPTEREELCLRPACTSLQSPVTEKTREKISLGKSLCSIILALWIIGVMAVMYAVTQSIAFDRVMASVGISPKAGDAIRAQLTRKNIFQEAEK